MRYARFVLTFCLVSQLLSVATARAEQSPVFGAASIEAMSQAAARDITARGYWANYFGNLSITYAYQAYIYSFYARNYATTNSVNEQNWYGSASQNALLAYTYAAWAQYYSSVGM